MSSDEDSFKVGLNVDLSRPLSSITGRPSIHKMDCSGKCKSSPNNSDHSFHQAHNERMRSYSQSCEHYDDSENSILPEESRDEVDRAIRTPPRKTRDKPKSCPTTPDPELIVNLSFEITPQPLKNKKSPQSKTPILRSPSEFSNTVQKDVVLDKHLFINGSRLNDLISDKTVQQNASSKRKKIIHESTINELTSEIGYKINKEYWIPCLIIVLLSLIVAVYYRNNKTIYETKTTVLEPERLMNQFRTNLNEFRKQYSINAVTMSFLQNVVEKIWKDSSTSGFVFVYGRQCHGTIDEERASIFASEYAQIVANFMRNNNNKPIKPIELYGANLDMPTKGELIMKYQQELNQGGVLLLRRLDTLSDIVALDLHYYCDEIEPLVPRSLVLFTINMRNCGSCQMPDKNNITEERPQQSVRKCLSSKWKKLQSSILTPLLTRVANVVIDLDPILFR